MYNKITLKKKIWTEHFRIFLLWYSGEKLKINLNVLTKTLLTNLTLKFIMLLFTILLIILILVIIDIIINNKKHYHLFTVVGGALHIFFHLV